MSKIYYTPEHEWLSVEGNVATVGITDHAQDQLGDLVFVDLPDVGTAVEKDSDAAVVESVKAASDVFAPVSGKVTEINESLSSDPSLVNSSAQDKGWLYKMELSDPSQLEGLMDEAAYKALIS